jgi:hypothetical protein
MTSVNISIIYSSLKYIKKNFNIISQISKHIYDQLILLKYNDLKLIKAFNKNDVDIAKTIIHLNEDKSILNICLYNCTSQNDVILCEIIQLLLDNGANITYAEKLAELTMRSNFIETIYLLRCKGLKIPEPEFDFQTCYRTIYNYFSKIELSKI